MRHLATLILISIASSAFAADDIKLLSFQSPVLYPEFSPYSDGLDDPTQRALTSEQECERSGVSQKPVRLHVRKAVTSCSE